MTDEGGAKPKPSQAGMIPRRIEMPIPLWNEVLALSKDGGIDYRDALLQLIDLGLQAQDEENYKPRLVPVDHDVWQRVKAARLKGVSDQEALAYLVDLGLQAWSARGQVDGPVPKPNGVRVRIDLVGGEGEPTRLAELRLPEGTLPNDGDAVTLGGKHYAVAQRAWALSGPEPTVYLRVKPYGDAA